ncbi:unnamed protein product [Vitrella brassicaformis CCMP3155]|uniref:Uncharacterized protein n=3 Tax=Vitrella brassicaformis TaxID=1169539 RepID=A0A0G4G4X6_VITBC|nr:unnamed protein product [Vitrella brassicaformis CCMP3155]|eukprot:CEM23374.1 unnamed protein product [Vitrella brassicaformis CCMP3155]
MADKERSAAAVDRKKKLLQWKQDKEKQQHPHPPVQQPSMIPKPKQAAARAPQHQHQHRPRTAASAGSAAGTASASIASGAGDAAHLGARRHPAAPHHQHHLHQQQQHQHQHTVVQATEDQHTLHTPKKDNASQVVHSPKGEIYSTPDGGAGGAGAGDGDGAARESKAIDTDGLLERMVRGVREEELRALMQQVVECTLDDKFGDSVGAGVGGGGVMGRLRDVEVNLGSVGAVERGLAGVEGKMEGVRAKVDMVLKEQSLIKEQLTQLLSMTTQQQQQQQPRDSSKPPLPVPVPDRTPPPIHSFKRTNPFFNNSNGGINDLPSSRLRSPTFGPALQMAQYLEKNAILGLSRDATPQVQVALADGSSGFDEKNGNGGGEGPGGRGVGESWPILASIAQAGRVEVPLDLPSLGPSVAASPVPPVVSEGEQRSRIREKEYEQGGEGGEGGERAGVEQTTGTNTNIPLGHVPVTPPPAPAYTTRGLLTVGGRGMSMVDLKDLSEPFSPNTGVGATAAVTAPRPIGPRSAKIGLPTRVPMSSAKKRGCKTPGRLGHLGSPRGDRSPPLMNIGLALPRDPSPASSPVPFALPMTSSPSMVSPNDGGAAHVAAPNRANLN